MAVTNILAASTNAVATAAGAVNTASNMVAAVSGASNLASALRSIDLPSAGEIAGDLYVAAAAFANDPAANDWRVRLSLPTWPSFQTSPVLAPLKDAGGLIFPYTPTISMASSATYTTVNTVHTNYTFRAFQTSDPGAITITAPMNVEDATQGLYWIAAVHYLRSLTKMFTGNDPKAGNPPPIVMLNGYGNYVFKNVPVVVTNFTTSLDDKCDYIGVPVVGSAAGIIEGVADQTAALASTIGGVFGGGIAGVTDVVSEVAGGVGQVAAIGALFGAGGSTSGGTSYVPTKSSFTVTLQPVYSRQSARNFSLDRFVEGGYLNNPFGYI
jgi:hypothetical protein